MKADLSARDARRLALAAQGFGRPLANAPGRAEVLGTIRRLGLVQMDSVNVLARSHYIPLFSRLGAYPRQALEAAAWGGRPGLFEYWMHEASLAPLGTQPFLRWRMEDAAAGVGVWRGVAAFLRSHGGFIDRVLDEIRDRGPLSAAELGLGAKGAGGWWGWSESKRALECLFWTGRLTTATRRGAFERVYGLPSQVHPPALLDAPAPDRAEAQRELVRIAA
ncbi:MAG: DNA glycosylase AlkZ-like family protein, partial [Phenylobacterium sp.]